MNINSQRPFAETAAEPPATDETSSALGLVDAYLTLKRHRRFIIGFTLIATFLLVAVLLSLRPRYTANVEIMIDPRERHVTNVEEVLSGLPKGAETVESQIQIITSRLLAERAMDALGLDRVDEFDPETERRGFFFERLEGLSPGLAAWAEGWWESLKSLRSEDEEETAGLAPQRLEERRRSAVIEALQNRTSAERVSTSMVISVRFSSEDPLRAAAVVNKLADLYVESQLEAKYEATRRANDWLGRRLLDLRQTIDNGERAVEAFREGNGLIGGEMTTLAEQNLADLNTQLVLERAHLAETQARLSQVRRAAAAGTSENLGEVLSSPLIQTLRANEATAERTLAELSSEFGDRHPKILIAKADIERAKEKIKAEVERIVSALENDMRVAQARVDNIQAAVDERRQRVGEENNARVRLRALEREVEANRQLFETLLLRSKETASQEDFQQADASIIAPAAEPLLASYPRKTLLTLIGGFAAALAACLLTFLIEIFTGRGVRTQAELTSALRLPCLALVPRVQRFSRRPERLIRKKPFSPYTESIRGLLNGLRQRHPSGRGQAVMIASATPNEGKTSLCLSLAMMARAQDLKVLVIDGDLRRPSLERRLGRWFGAKLENYLRGEAGWDEIVANNRATGIDYIVSGQQARLLGHKLGGTTFAALLDKARANYDLVLLDSSPISLISDGLEAASAVDSVLLTVRWNKTPRDLALAAQRKLAGAGASFSGAVLQAADLSRLRDYNSYEGSAYSYHGRRYFT